MKQLLLFLGLFLLPSCLSSGENCLNELVKRWNVFAQDANTYVTGLNRGVVDATLRTKVDEEWARLHKCECW